MNSLKEKVDMTKLMRISLIVGILFLTSCATSMSPFKVNSTLPSLTKYRFISQTEANKLVEVNKCKYLVKGRIYVAPMGLTTKNDLKNAAKGIDEWVKLDGGNAYVLKNYKWVTVDQNGSTQLHIKFDTMLCE